MSDENTHVHEAAHGWFGDGIRLRCWEDFVLSEGTVSYLAAGMRDMIDLIEQETGFDTSALVESRPRHRFRARGVRGTITDRWVRMGPCAWRWPW